MVYFGFTIRYYFAIVTNRNIFIAALIPFVFIRKTFGVVHKMTIVDRVKQFGSAAVNKTRPFLAATGNAALYVPRQIDDRVFKSIGRMVSNKDSWLNAPVTQIGSMLPYSYNVVHSRNMRVGAAALMLYGTLAGGGYAIAQPFDKGEETTGPIATPTPTPTPMP